jgi:hypothetical protein
MHVLSSQINKQRKKKDDDLFDGGDSLQRLS